MEGITKKFSQDSYDYTKNRQEFYYICTDHSDAILEELFTNVKNKMKVEQLTSIAIYRILIRDKNNHFMKIHNYFMNY